MPARDDLGVRHRGYAEFGAIHRLAPTREVFNFFAEVTEIADGIIIDNHEPTSDSGGGVYMGPLLEIEGINVVEDTPEAQEPVDESWYESDDYYRIYDHSSVWVGVLEANAARKKAQAARRVLQANDVGIMKQEVRDASARIYPNTPMKLLFDSVTLVGHKQVNGKARGMQTHVALVPNLEEYPDTTERLFREYDIITSFLRRHYRQTFLSDRYTPHAEFMTFRKGADHSDVSNIVEGIKGILAKNPLHIPLKELEFPDPRLPRSRSK